MQASILEGLEPEKAAEIVQEMSPDEAADVLQELEEETAGEILEEMEPEVEHEVRELLSFKENTAGGLMNTEYIALPSGATAADALAALKSQPELAESVTALLLEDQAGIFAGSVLVTRVLLADASAPLGTLIAEPLAKVHVNEREDRVVETFDKYNLLALAVVDDDERIAGVITADDVISLLAAR
jgi:Mg/Co/Ni transporter MgtE